MKIAPPGEVVFLAGSGGSGKSTSLNDSSKVAIFVDRTLTSYGRARTQIGESFKSGRAVGIRYFYRPIEEAVAATLERVLEAEFQNGRAVPIASIAHAYRESRLTVLKLEKEFRGKVYFEFNRIENGVKDDMTIEQVRAIPDADISSLEKRARDTAEKWFSENSGREGVTPAFRKAVLGE